MLNSFEEQYDNIFTYFVGRNKSMYNPTYQIWYDNINHWVLKKGLRKWSISGCEGTSDYFPENVMLTFMPIFSKLVTVI